MGDSVALIRSPNRDTPASPRRNQITESDAISRSASESLRHVIDVAKEKRSSSWLTCRPLEKYRFNLSKREFWDGLYLRYGWILARAPSHYS